MICKIEEVKAGVKARIRWDQGAGSAFQDLLQTAHQAVHAGLDSVRLEGAVGDAEVAYVGQAEADSRNDGDTEFGYQTLHHGHGSQLGVKSSKQVEGAVGTGDDAGWGENVEPVQTHLADPRDLLHERGAVLAARLKGAEGGPLGDDGGQMRMVSWLFSNALSSLREATM